MAAVKMKEHGLPLPRPAKEPIIEIIDSGSDSDSEEIQVTKVTLSQKQKTDILTREAIWFYREKKYKLALEKLEAVFALDQNNVMALVALGVNTYRLGKSDQACELLTRALVLSPNHIDAIIAKATILCNNEDIDGSLELLERGLIHFPKENASFMQDSKYIKAKSYYRQIADLKAQNYLKDKNLKEATKMYEKIVQFDPENIEINKILVSLRRKASVVTNELVCLSSDEEDDDDNDVKEKPPIQVSRDTFRELSDEDHESGPMNNSYNERVSQFLKNRSESKDLPEEKETVSERRLSEGQRDKSERNFSATISNDVPESHKCKNIIYDDGLEKSVALEVSNINEIDNSLKSPSKKLKNHEVNDLHTNTRSPGKESNNKTTENQSMSKNDHDLITKVNSPERELTNRTPDNNDESSLKRKKKRSLPKLKRLPIGYMVQHSQVIGQEKESTKTDQAQPGISNGEEMNESQSNGHKNVDLSNSSSANNLYDNDMIIENETEYSREDSDYIEYQNTEKALFDREKGNKENKNLRSKEGSKPEDNTDTRESEEKNRKHNKVEKDRNNSKNKREEANQIKSTYKRKNDSCDKSSERINERSKDKKDTDKSHQRSSRSSRKSSKNDKSKKSSKSYHQSDEESDVEKEIFGINTNSLNASGLDDLPDIETSNTKCYNHHKQDTSGSEYDELRELQKDIERSNSVEGTMSKKQDTENQLRKGINLEKTSKTTCDFLDRLRKENEKTKEREKEISNRLAPVIQPNTAKNPPTRTPAKENNRGRAIFLIEPIVPPSEIKKRRRRRNADLFEDEEETPKKKYVRKSINSESPSEATAGPSNVQETPILSTPQKEPSVDMQTLTHKPVKPSSSKKESLTGPRGKSIDFLRQGLCVRHASVRKEYKHLDEEDIKDLAENIEAELYNLFNRDTGKEYKTKLRSLLFNIKDTNNVTLFRKILNRKVSPKELVRMDKNELASEELARWNKKREQKTINAIVETEREKVLASNCQVILKNHKGELEIQNDYAKEALDTLNILPEDFSIDLNIKSSRGNKNKKEKNRHKSSRR